MKNAADAIIETLISPNVADSNGENANVVDVLDRLANGAHRIASAIRPNNSCVGSDAAGGTVDSLTEAVMGITTGLCRIADSISELAEAIREKQG